MSEKAITITAKGQPASGWFLDLCVADKDKTAFRKIIGNSALYEFHGHSYRITPTHGSMKETTNGSLYRIYPKGDHISIKLADVEVNDR